MNKLRTAFLHVFIWIAILLLFIYVSSRNGAVKDSIVIFLYFGLVNIAIFYINYLYILPNYLNSRRYLGCTLSIILLVLFSACVKYAIASIFSEIILVQGHNQDYYVNFWEYLFIATITGTFFVFLSTAYKFTVDWFLNEKIRKSLENEKLSTELAFLRSQINPHFLFNSLNNIYSLAYQQSEKTPEAILKLSEIMRYMLEDSNEPKVPLHREIRYLKNYIELQTLRFKNGAFVDFGIKAVEDQIQIIPLILIAFVENAFKHGIVSDADHPVKIDLQVQHNLMIFEVWNLKSAQNKDNTGGIGLSNVKRRLELLYEGRYELLIDETISTYYCKLALHL
ncbi:sensor histidine kinase [Arcticibacter eurypsychrophilus]|uniref:sensor histidine kinase n=1 Tax=Arcticibacter eurypsychrophilus TaxID=1434752 RepID=UPI00084DF4F7|nr:histidine kinase [Arcticibacter eurypsychrophilus]